MVTSFCKFRRALPSLHLDVGGLDDRRPARNLALDEGGKRRLAALRLVGNVASEIREALAHGGIVERLVERGRERVEHWFRRSLGGKQGVPAEGLELGQAGLLGGWDVRQRRVALGRRDR